MLFLWLPSVELAATRVRRRVEQGGHDVPLPDIRRRFARGLLNFFDGYKEIATAWRLYDASLPGRHALVARGVSAGPAIIVEPDTWDIIQFQVNRLRREGVLGHDKT